VKKQVTTEAAEEHREIKGIKARKWGQHGFLSS